jgi:hypothetical protein
MILPQLSGSYPKPHSHNQLDVFWEYAISVRRLYQFDCKSYAAPFHLLRIVFVHISIAADK